MEKIKSILAISIVISLTSCVDMSEYNYKIYDSQGDMHWVKSYQKTEGGCVKFRTEASCGCAGESEVTVCGNYKIVKMNKK